jgi:hypothetical protein
MPYVRANGPTMAHAGRRGLYRAGLSVGHAHHAFNAADDATNRATHHGPDRPGHPIALGGSIDDPPGHALSLRSKRQCNGRHNGRCQKETFHGPAPHFG